MTTTEKGFEEGDWYSVGDGHETLSHTEWSECIGQHFDDTAERDMHIKAQCDQIGPLTVFAYKKKVLSKSFAEGMIDHLVEELEVADGWAENWWEEYGDMDGDHPPIGKATTCQVNNLKAALSEPLHEFLLRHAHIWQCDVSAQKEFSVDELEEFAKLNYPKEWNEKE